MPSSHNSSPSLPSIHELLPDHVFHDIAVRHKAENVPLPPRYDTLPQSMPSPVIDYRAHHGIHGDRNRSQANVAQAHAAHGVPVYTYPPPPAPTGMKHVQPEYPRQPHSHPHGRRQEPHTSSSSTRFAKHGSSFSGSSGNYSLEPMPPSGDNRPRSQSSPMPVVHSIESPYTPTSPLSTSDSPSESDELDEDDDIPNSISVHSVSPARSNDLLDDVGGRRHECPHCHRRFNRPSSLGIHINTHTGARPFICQYPGCGKAFNVNSNMRRHYRKHLSASELSGQYPAGYSSSHTPQHATADLHIIRYQDGVPEPVRQQRRSTELDVKEGRSRPFSWEPANTGFARDRSKLRGLSHR